MINRDILKIYQFTSKDKFRKSLQYIKVDFADGKATLTATDSYKLMRVVTTADVFGDDKSPFTAYYSREDFQKLYKLCGKFGVKMYRGTLHCEGMTLKSSPVDDFPDVDPLIKSATKEREEKNMPINLNPTYIKEVSDYMNKLTPQVTLEVFNKNAPAIFTFNNLGVEGLGLIMPLRS